MHQGEGRKPNRTIFWNYSHPGSYFVTICTKNRFHYFGKIQNKLMLLNEYGKIAHQNFLAIPNHFSGIEIDEFVIMPDHIHGIIHIRRGQACLPPTDGPNTDRPYQKLPIVIGSYKSAVTKNINQIDVQIGFKWQKSYHDRIIRNENELNRIRQYIRQNPEAWSLNKNY